MMMKRLLLVVPFVVIIVLVQSFFWVPTYDDQVKGHPDRLVQFIEGSIGDASILNPILSADSASSTINGQVFEGLIDYDQDLRYRGRLATHWHIYEEAFFLVNDQASFPDGTPIGAEDIVARIEQARVQQAAQPMKWLTNIDRIEVLPAQTLTQQVRHPQTEKDAAAAPLTVTLNLPERIKITLHEVDQDLFTHLTTILGSDYFTTIAPERYLQVPDAALSTALAAQLIQITEHNPIIVFFLRRGVRFHDGQAFDADDVKFTYEAIMNPANLSPRVSDFEPVKQVRVLDSHTLEIVYKRLYSPAFGTWSMGMLPQHLLNREALANEARTRGLDPNTFTMRDSTFNRQPIGVGPFKFQEWKSDELIRLVRNDDYWEGPPAYKEYVYRILPDLLGQEMSFYAGTVDLYSAQAHQVARLQNDPRYQHFSGLALGYTYIGYNLRRDLFKDPRVRRALGMAINVNEMLTYLFYGQAEPITGPFVKQTDYYNHDVQPLPYDPEGAQRLLAEAGWHKVNDRLEKDGQPFEFTLLTNHGNDERKAIMIIAQNAWKKLGINVQADTVEWAVFLKKHINVGNFDAVILGWSMGIDPDLYQIWHSSQSGPFQLNFVGYQSPEADDLIVKIRREYDHAQQVAYTHHLHRLIYADQPYTFLYVKKWTALLDKKIVIRDVAADGTEHYAPIRSTQTGNFRFYFNKWIKLPHVPVLTTQ
jgi:ABC-type transport system substrate-binding protein